MAQSSLGQEQFLNAKSPTIAAARQGGLRPQDAPPDFGRRQASFSICLECGEDRRFRFLLFWWTQRRRQSKAKRKRRCSPHSIKIENGKCQIPQAHPRPQI
jgi:hypothetical protein